MAKEGRDIRPVLANYGCKGLIGERREPANTAVKLGDELHGLFSELEDAALLKKKKKVQLFTA